MERIKKGMHTATFVMLCICTLFVPLVGTITIPSSTQVFLVLAALFCLVAFIQQVIENTLLKVIWRGKWFALFFAVILIVSTAKYVSSVLNQQGITFFAVYQMVIFSAFGCMAFAVLLTNTKALSMVMAILSCVVTVLILAFQNRFLLDLGVYRFIAAYSSPNILGIYSVTAFFATLYFLLSKVGPKWMKWLMLFNAAVNSVATILTGSRASILALLGGLIVFVVFSVKKINKMNLKQVAISIVAFLAFFGVLFQMLKPVPEEDLRLIMGSELVPADSTVTQEPTEEIVGTQEPTEEIVGTQELSEETVGTDSFTQESTTETITESITTPGGSEEKMESSWELFLKRFSLEEDGKSSIKNNLRLRIWVEYLKAIPDFGLFGTDYLFSDRPSVDGVKWDPHNTFLYSIFRFGGVGLFALVWLLFTIGIKLLIRKKNMGDVTVFGMFASLLITCLFIDLLNVACFYLLLAITYAVAVEREHISSEA